MPVTLLPFIAANANAATAPQGRAANLFVLMASDPGQQRPSVVWSPAIAAVAQARANMQLHDGAIFVNHLDANGRGPNKWLRDAGIAIPDYYSHYPGQQGPDDHENNVESIGLNDLTADICWREWLKSPAHRTHVLGEADTFRSQTQVGIGFSAPTEAKYPIFWVLISVPPQE